jgi:hypothetical protein
MSNLQGVAGLIGVILRLPEFHAPVLEWDHAATLGFTQRKFKGAGKPPAVQIELDVDNSAGGTAKAIFGNSANSVKVGGITP